MVDVNLKAVIGMGQKHIGISKLLLIELLRRDGDTSILDRWTGTVEEAIAVLKGDPRKVICSCGCAKDSRGACVGWSN